MIQQANAIWLRELPEAIETGRTKLMAHDMFTEQSVKGAEVYFMRYLLFVSLAGFLLCLLTLTNPLSHVATTGQMMSVLQYSPTSARL